MKKIDDQDIKNILSNGENYYIKSKPEDVIKKFEVSKIEKVNKRSYGKFWFLSTTGLVVAISSVALIILFAHSTKFENIDSALINEDTYSFSKNPVLAKQFLTFSFFNTLDSSENLNNRANYLKKQSSDYSENDFYKAVDAFDLLSFSVYSLFDINEFTYLEEEVSYEYLGVTYNKKTSIIRNENEFSTYYFSESKSKKVQKGLFIDNNSEFYEFKLKVDEKSETDETKYQAIFSSLNENNSSVYVVKKEVEYDGVESENTYSIRHFLDETSHQKNEVNYFIEYEIENEIDEKSIEVTYMKNSKKSEFSGIQLINSNTLEFIAEKIENNSSFEEPITLEFKDIGRFYTFSDFSVVKK